MLYISKGAVLRPSEISRIYVSRCGLEYELQGDQAKLWLSGRFGVANAENKQQCTALKELETLGLVESADAAEDIARYQLLTNCVICRADPAASCSLLSRKERLLWKWIAGAGGKLTISELVCLTEKELKPEPAYMGKNNWHTLVDAIYSAETIFDGILDAKMERSPAMNKTVLAVLGLLRKKRILLV